MEGEKSLKRKQVEPPDWLIQNIADASKIAAKIYIIYIGFLLYCVITVLGSSDRQLILNETTHLPIINLNVSFTGFYIAAPLIAIFIFLYLQMYLSRIKGLTADLRKNYSSVGKRRLYPWMLNIAEDPEPGLLGKLQKNIVKFAVWYFLPIVLFIIAMGYVKKHEPILSYIVGLMPLLGTVIVIFLWHSYDKNEVFIELELRNFKKLFKLNMSKIYLASCVLIFSISLITIITLSNQGQGISVQLSHQNLVNEPAIDYPGVYWIDLQGLHLEGAKLDGVVLKRANLSNASFRRADLGWANLEGAMLYKVNLQNAEMSSANLQKAQLAEGNLEGAHLSLANLREAFLFQSNLQWADLLGAHLQKVYLNGANLQNAYLGSANLQGARLTGINLQNANLRYANLKQVNFWHANLQGANLNNASLQGADLTLANLQGVKNCTIKQLAKAKRLHCAILPSELMEQVKKNYPHLLISKSDCDDMNRQFQEVEKDRELFLKSSPEEVNRQFQEQEKKRWHEE
jgi:uncharacterized protein YjbI with pentapeptide repeats